MVQLMMADLNASPDQQTAKLSPFTQLKIGVFMTLFSSESL
jgi:hypothetical protein